MQQDFGKLPLSFEANQRQTDSTVNFLSRGQRHTLFLTATEAVMRLQQGEARTRRHGESAARNSESAVIRMQFDGANASPGIAGLDVLPGKSNFLTGADQRNWRTDIPTFAKVNYSVLDSTNVINEVFVTCLNANGSGAIFSTFLGGSGVEQGFAIAVDAARNVYVAGKTNSTNFPRAQATQQTLGGGFDGFLTKIAAGGTSILFSTYLGAVAMRRSPVWSWIRVGCVSQRQYKLSQFSDHAGRAATRRARKG